MSNKEFIDQIIEQYNQAKKLTVNGYEQNIERGKKRSISGIAEDLFAIWLFKNLANDALKFLVDKPVSYNFIDKKTKTIQPDIVILNGDMIVGCIDIKMDLGWTKEFESYIQDKNLLIESIKGKSCWTTYSHTGEKYQRSHVFSKNILYQIVVLSGQNKTDRKISAIENMAEYPNVKTYVLTTGQHLNMDEKNLKRGNINIIDSQFEAIKSDLFPQPV